MKFLNLKRKLKNSALAVLFAVAVMFVMPATAFADDTYVIDNDLSINAEAEAENNIDNNDNMNSEAVSDAELSAENEDIAEDFVDNTEPENTDQLTPCGNCYGICCDTCDENCNGTCCDMCTIINNADVENVPDNSEYESEDDFTAGEDVSDETDNVSEEGVLDNFYGGITAEPTDEFTNPNENLMPVIPNAPIFPEDYYNNGMFPENPEPEYVYQPEFGSEPTDADADNDENIDNKNEEEIISDDDFTGEEEEIIFGDDDLTDEENSEIPDDSDSENFDNPDEEDADNTTDEENNDDSDAEDESDADNENSEDIADEEISDNENSDDMADEDDSGELDGMADDDEDDSDSAADDENTDDSDSEALEDDNPIINVVLPASISVAVNPYNLKINSENGDFGYSILSPEYSIKNYSNCDVSIVATVTASTTGGIVLSPHSLNGNETDFMAFVYIEATNESDVYLDKYNDSENQLAFSNEAVSKKILTLANGSDNETIGYFRIKGDAVLPVGKQCSDQAMINMVITFDIDPVSKSVVSDDKAEETEDVENTENSENVEDIENSENVEDTENSENVEDIENSENVENTENSENVENIENSEDVENSENIENTENSENVENSENSENIENTENSEDVENTENFENLEIIEDFESLENIQEIIA